MQDDPPQDTEDEFDGMLDDAPTTSDNTHGCCPGCMMSMTSPPPNPYGDNKDGNK